MALFPSERERVGLAEVYDRLDRAKDAVADLALACLHVVPDGDYELAVVALQQLCLLGMRVMPEPDEGSPF